MINCYLTSAVAGVRHEELVAARWDVVQTSLQRSLPEGGLSNVRLLYAMVPDTPSTKVGQRRNAEWLVAILCLIDIDHLFKFIQSPAVFSLCLTVVYDVLSLSKHQKD